MNDPFIIVLYTVAVYVDEMEIKVTFQIFL